MFERIKSWFRGAQSSVESVEEGEPVATPPPGSDPLGTGEEQRETSTNAQTEGAAGEPWPGKPNRG
jgi:hypothetical protein